MLKDIGVDKIQVGIVVTSLEEAIIKSSRILLENGAIEPRYVDAMVEIVKNNAPCIVISEHVVLAHARPECGVNSFDMSFTTLKHGINFGSEFDPIKMIVTLATTNSDNHIDTLMELSELLLDENKMDKLFNAKSSDEFLEEMSK